MCGMCPWLSVLMRYQSTLRSGRPGTSTRASSRPKVPRVGFWSTTRRSPSFASTLKKLATDPPAPKRWQCAQFTWSNDRARASSAADPSWGSVQRVTGPGGLPYPITSDAISRRKDDADGAELVSSCSGLNASTVPDHGLWQRMHSARPEKRHACSRLPPGMAASAISSVVFAPLAGTRSASVWASFQR